MIKYAFF
jgi:clathrin heavy chain